MPETPLEEFITIIDNSGRKKLEQVAYSVNDIFSEKVYVTEDGLQYARDSLHRKGQISFISHLERIPHLLVYPDIVIRDPHSAGDTSIYYKRFYNRQKRRYQVVALIIKMQGSLKFLYNLHQQQSGKVKGYQETPKPKILYLNPRRKPSDFGL